MRRLVIVVPLAEGTEQRAVELLTSGPPFAPEDTGLESHGVYLSRREVVFVFEGVDVESQVDDLMSDFFRPGVTAAIDAWKPLLAASPRVAQERYFWRRAGGSGEADGGDS